MDKKRIYLFLTSKIGSVFITLILAAFIYGILVLALCTELHIITLALLIICGYFGWISLTKITPNIFLWMSFAGWALYFLIKGILSGIIGVFIAPFKLGKIIGSHLQEKLASLINNS